MVVDGAETGYRRGRLLGDLREISKFSLDVTVAEIERAERLQDVPKRLDVPSGPEPS